VETNLSKISQYKSFIKINSAVPELLHKYIRTDIERKLIDAFVQLLVTRIKPWNFNPRFQCKVVHDLECVTWCGLLCSLRFI